MRARGGSRWTRQPAWDPAGLARYHYDVLEPASESQAPLNLDLSDVEDEEEEPEEDAGAEAGTDMQNRRPGSQRVCRDVGGAQVKGMPLNGLCYDGCRRQTAVAAHA